MGRLQHGKCRPHPQNAYTTGLALVSIGMRPGDSSPEDVIGDLETVADADLLVNLIDFCLRRYPLETTSPSAMTRAAVELSILLEPAALPFVRNPMELHTP